MPDQGNIIAAIALLTWVPVSLWAARRWPPATAAALLLVGGLLFLPQKVAFKLPGIPGFSKTEITVLWATIAMWAFHRQRFSNVPLSNTMKFLLGCVVIGPAFTVFLNMDPITYGVVHLPQSTPYDVVHFTAEAFFGTALPFILAATIFRTPRDLKALLMVLAGAGVVYSGFQLVELVLSPQLHRWIYGFHPHEFRQAMRGGGYRPMVFLGHGLAVSMFTFVAALSAVLLWKVKTRVFGFPAIYVAGWLTVVIVLAKSVAAMVYTMCTMGLVLMASPKNQLRVAAALALVILAYPALRASGAIPMDTINEFAVEQFGEDRAAGLMFRFEHEGLVLERTLERIWFGWGGYCRGCVFDPIHGGKIAVFDGRWIVTLNSYGIVGFVGVFGVLLVPVLFCWRRFGRIGHRPSQILIAGVAVLVSVCGFNLIPNSSSYLPFLLSGALYGSTHGAIEQSKRARSKKRAIRLAAAKRARQNEATVAARGGHGR